MTRSTTTEGKAITLKKTFSRETSISIRIHAKPAVIWQLLTNAGDFPRWNSTIISLSGNIEPGGKLKLVSTLDPKRTFKLKVKEVESEKRLVWGDAQGNRIYTLSPQSDGSVLFSMNEKIGSPMFPLYSKYIPPFDQSFEQFAADLKKEAESIAKTR